MSLLFLRITLHFLTCFTMTDKVLTCIEHLTTQVTATIQQHNIQKKTDQSIVNLHLFKNYFKFTNNPENITHSPSKNSVCTSQPCHLDINRGILPSLSKVIKQSLIFWSMNISMILAFPTLAICSST